MKITALLVLKCSPEGSEPVILANASDVGHFGYFQRSSVKEFIVFVGRTVAKRTPPSQRQSVQHEGSFSPTISGFQLLCLHNSVCLVTEKNYRKSNEMAIWNFHFFFVLTEIYTIASFLCSLDFSLRNRSLKLMNCGTNRLILGILSRFRAIKNIRFGELGAFWG